MFKQYYQLTKPGIIYGNLMTAMAGFLFASQWHINLVLCLALLLGTSLVIASGCVLNNYIDRSIDQKMSRTKKRALVTRAIPVSHAIIFAICLAVAGFVVLIYTNGLVELIGFIALFSYVVLYGIAKRRTPYGTLVGTVPGAASLVAGYVAVTNRFDLAAFLLFLIMVVWQMPHFFSIAIRRLEDYRAAGIPVWPARNGIPKTQQHIFLYIIIFAVANVCLSLSGYVGYVYAGIMILCSGYWFFKGATSLRRLDSTKWAGSMFGLSLVVLLSLSGMLSIGRFLP